MMLSDEQHWLKAGIEFYDGTPAIGSALTPGNSNCATGLFPGDPKEFWLSLTRKMLYDCSTPQMDSTGHYFAYVISQGPSKNGRHVLYTSAPWVGGRIS